MLTMPCTTVVQHQSFTFKFLYCNDSRDLPKTGLFCWKPIPYLFTAYQYISYWKSGLCFVGVFFLVVERTSDDNMCSPEFPGVATKQFSMSCLACGVKSPVKKQCVFVCVCVCTFTIFWRKLIIDVNLYTLLESTPKPVQASEYLQL